MKRFLKEKRGQIAPFMIMIIAVLLLAIAATRLIGEAAFQRVRLANIADSGLITASSGLCRDLNQIRQISLGDGGLMVHYVGLQAHLLAHRVSCCERTVRGYQGKGAPLADGTVINSLLESSKLYGQAKNIASEAPKKLRSGLYNNVFSGALIDEPKPFKESDINYVYEEEKPGEKKRLKTITLNYDDYLARPSQFELELRKFRESEGWYNNTTISYSWNKSKEKFIEAKGQISTDSLAGAYEAYLSVRSNNVTGNVSVDPQLMPMIYFYRKVIPATHTTPCKCIYPLMGILPHPWAWINSIDLDSSSFGLTVTKSVPFRPIPFFAEGQDKDKEGEKDRPPIEHENRVRITGSAMGWGFKPELEK